MPAQPQRLVIKIGTGVLTRGDGIRLDDTAFLELARALSVLLKAGHQVLVVSSGAVGAGLLECGHDRRPEDTPSLQAFAAIGQARLMQTWRTHLQHRDLLAAQLLLSYADLESADRSGRILRTVDRLLEFGNVIPVINENDSVAVEELRFGDNDTLSARVAALVGARQLILLTSVDGLYRHEPDGHPTLVARLDDLDEARAWLQPGLGTLSVGGMASKLDAASVARSHGIPAVIAHGRHADRLPAIVDGEAVPCTRIPAAP